MTTETLNTFRKYDHLERLGHRNTRGIEIGPVYVFPKIDGTNSSVWYDGERVRAGSRTRTLSPEHDNAGFCAWAMSADPVAEALTLLCVRHPNWIIYGEWLVPHTLKTYRDDAWRRFWIFDVFDRKTGRYLSYDEYSKEVEAQGYNQADGEVVTLDMVHPLCIIENPTEEQLLKVLRENTYLIKDGEGEGEGIVLKNYGWYQPEDAWAKIVSNAFRENNRKAFGIPKHDGAYELETAIVEEFVTAELVNKTRAKVDLDVWNGLSEDEKEALRVPDEIDGPSEHDAIEANYRHRVIPQLLGRVWNDLIEEEMWAILRKHKGATINFKVLNSRTILRTKELAADLF